MDPDLQTKHYTNLGLYKKARKFCTAVLARHKLQCLVMVTTECVVN